MILKITLVLKTGIANAELVEGNFGEVVRSIAHEVKHTKVYKFVIITKVENESN